MEQEFAKEGCSSLKAKQAIVLVGGIVSNGTKTREGEREKTKLAGKRLKAYRKVVERIAQLPFSYDDRANTVSIYATPVLTFGGELHIPLGANLRALGKKVHHVLNAKRSQWKSNAIAFTLLTNGHRLSPW